MKVRELIAYLSCCPNTDEICLVDFHDQGNIFRVSDALSHADTPEIPTGVVYLCPMISVKPKVK